MPELIKAGEPAIMFGHWAGFYSNGSKNGFAHCRKVIAFDAPTGTSRQITQGGQAVALKEARALRDLKPGNWIRVKDTVIACFNLSKGKSILDIQP